MQIRDFSKQTIQFYSDILQQFKGSIIESIEFVIKYQPEFNKESLLKITDKYQRISSIFVHSAYRNETIHIDPQDRGNIYFLNQKIVNTSHCGIMSPQNFTINTKIFTESQHHNTCLNRKISIGVDGNIKNCPSMSESFGNIKDTTLQKL